MSRILIIDEGTVAGLQLRALLADELHDVVSVKDATSGIKALALSKFDLVIVDIFLARMDGVALIARLRGLAIQLPIICMTGIKSSEMMRPSLDFSDLAMEAGATCCIRMPLNRRQVLEAVNANLGPAKNPEVIKLRPELSAETPPNPQTAILEGHDLKLVQGQVTYALKATDRAFQTIEPNGKTQSGASDTADVIGLENQPINLSPALQCDPHAISLGRGRLTPREREVLALVIDGASNKSGSVRLSISVRTFETHRANVMDKLGAKNTAELVRFGLERVRCFS